MNAVLCSSLPRHQGRNSIDSLRQSDVQCYGTVHEELDEDLHSAASNPVFFDVGDDISYVSWSEFHCSQLLIKILRWNSYDSVVKVMDKCSLSQLKICPISWKMYGESWD